MNSAGTGDPLGQDLTSFGNLLLELIYIFVINGFGLVGAELADLLPPYAASFIHHFFFLLDYRRPECLPDLLKGNIVVIVQSLESVGEVEASCGSCGCGSGESVHSAVISGALVAPIEEFYSVSNYIGSVAGFAVLILVAAGLDPSGNCSLTTLA